MIILQGKGKNKNMNIRKKIMQMSTYLYWENTLHWRIAIVKGAVREDISPRYLWREIRIAFYRYLENFFMALEGFFNKRKWRLIKERHDEL